MNIYEQINAQAEQAYPPDGTIEQNERKIEFAFRQLYKYGLEAADLVPVNECEIAGLFKFAKFMFEAGRYSETSNIV